jgi:DNA-binding NtrC family response regulator
MMNILIVDDEKECLDDIEYSLQPANYKCIKTASPFDALSLYKKEKISIVVTDVKMAEMDGFTFLHELKKINPKVKVIFISSYIEFEPFFKDDDKNVCGFFTKPVDFNKFINKLREIESEIINL